MRRGRTGTVGGVIIAIAAVIALWVCLSAAYRYAEQENAAHAIRQDECHRKGGVYLLDRPLGRWVCVQRVP